jgi:hypothetical protein
VRVSPVAFSTTHEAPFLLPPQQFSLELVFVVWYTESTSGAAAIGDEDMAKKPARQGQKWTGADKTQLKKLIKQNTPTRVMGLKLQRSPGAVQGKANDMGLSTKPTNQSPYNRRKKS